MAREACVVERGQSLEIPGEIGGGFFHPYYSIERRLNCAPIAIFRTLWLRRGISATLFGEAAALLEHESAKTWRSQRSAPDESKTQPRREGGRVPLNKFPP